VASSTQIRQVAIKYGINPAVFAALVRQESGNDQGQRSPAGAIGLTQLMPATARSLGVNPYNARQNLEGGAKYLRQQLDAFGGDIRKALAAYNAGPGAVKKYGGPPFAETQNYVKSILSGIHSGGGSSVPEQQQASLPEPVQQNIPDTSGQQKLAAIQFLQAGGVKNSNALQALTSTIAALRQQAPAQQSIQQAAPAPSTPSPSGRGGSKVLELIYNDGGQGFGIKNGQVVNGPQVYSAVWAGHADHVHVAAGPKTIVRLGKLAQGLGLHVGENPNFGGVTPVHVQGSYHYKGEAIDVSGDPTAMKRYARLVERYNRTGRM
jgi:hypothetical protein